MTDNFEEYGEFSTTSTDEQVEQTSPERELVERAVKPTKKRRVRVCLDYCKYSVIHDICERRGWRQVGESDDWNLLWSDRSVTAERVMRMKIYQRINHFPSMYEITRKDTLAKNLNKIRKLMPDEYDFYPMSFYLPADSAEMRQYISKASKKSVYITKPVASCQGRGIRLFKNVDSIDTTEPQVVQEYVSKPYLIGGLKFDLRMYVLVVSVAPILRLLVYEDGMARFATEPYAEPTVKNMKKTYMHLTNYAINKRNENFIFNAEEDEDNVGSKWGLQAVWDKIAEDGGDLQKIKDEINDIFIKTILAVLPNLQHTYMSCRPAEVKAEPDAAGMNQQYFGSNCYEVLGFDIMIDSFFKPWLIEVNHSPSFTCDTPLDMRIKGTLIDAVLDVINITNGDRKQFARLERQKHMKRLYGKTMARPPQTQNKLPRPPQKKGSEEAQKKLSTFKTYEEHIQKCLKRLPFVQIYPLPKGCPDPYYSVLQRIRNKGSADLPDRPQNIIARGMPSQTSLLQTTGKRTASATPAAPAKIQPRQGSSAIAPVTDMHPSSSVPSLERQFRPESPLRRSPEPGSNVPSHSSTGVSNNVGTNSTTAPAGPSNEVLESEPFDSLLKRALLEFEYGIASRSIIFKGIQAPVLLPQGPPRNDKIEKTRDAELLSKMRAMLKFGVREYAESIIQAGQKSTQAALPKQQQQPPPQPVKQDINPMLMANRSKSSGQFHSAGIRSVPGHPDIHTASVSRGNYYGVGTGRIIRAYDEAPLPSVMYKGLFAKK